MIAVADETVLVGWTETQGEVKEPFISKTQTIFKEKSRSEKRPKLHPKHKGLAETIWRWPETDKGWQGLFTQSSSGNTGENNQGQDRQQVTQVKITKGGKTKTGRKTWQKTKEEKTRKKQNPRDGAIEWDLKMKLRKLLHRPIKPFKIFAERSLVSSPLSMYL